MIIPRGTRTSASGVAPPATMKPTVAPAPIEVPLLTIEIRLAAASGDSSNGITGAEAQRSRTPSSRSARLSPSPKGHEDEKPSKTVAKRPRRERSKSEGLQRVRRMARSGLEPATTISEDSEDES